MTPQAMPLPTRIGLAAVLAVVLASGGSSAQQAPVKMPQPGVPEIFTLEGEYVRVAYNNEGYVSLGYRVANQAVGEEWFLLEIGATLRDNIPNFVLKRDALSIETPDGKTIPMSSQRDYLNADLRAQEMRAKALPESISYFPPNATSACRLGFFAEQGSRAMSYDQVELSASRACLGRIYFRVPGGLKYGQHFLSVRFNKSVVKVPFRIVTKEEEKTLAKTWKDIKKQVDDAFKKK